MFQAHVAFHVTFDYHDSKHKQQQLKQVMRQRGTRLWKSNISEPHVKTETHQSSVDL